MARIAFCQDILVEHMSFMYMSAVLKEAGHTVEIFFDDQIDEKDFLSELGEFRPDIVGFSILSPSVPWALRVGERVKDRIGALTIFGNVHAIMNPDIVKEPGVDIVCIGEGEVPMRELARRVDKGLPHDDIPSLIVKNGDDIARNPNPKEMIDLDELPFHDRDLYDKYGFFRHSSYIRFMNGRGCPFRCTFCSNPALLEHYGVKEYIRKYTPARAIAELEHIVAKRNPKFVLFIDEVFWVKNDWLREFLALYKERIGIKFGANFRFGPIREDDVKLMAEAGADTFILAAETGDEGQRRKLMDKNVSNEAILKVAGWLHKYKIKFTSSCFFGLPGDTVEDHLERLDFYRKIRPSYLWTTFFQPYPGIKLTEAFEVKKHMPKEAEFESTLHHDMYLDLPDRQRLVHFKKVYYLMVAFPWMTPLLHRLTKVPFPPLFDVLFMLHFTYYIFKFERVSFVQYLLHLKVFAINPLLRKGHPLQSIGRPFAQLFKKQGKSA